MKKRIRLKGHIKSYIQFSIYLGILLLFVDAAVFLINLRAGLLLAGYTVVYYIITLSLYFYNKPIIMNELISFATEYGQIQRKLLRDMDLPYALLDNNGKVIWTNTAFEAVVKQPKGYNKSITSLFPTVTRDRLPDDTRGQAVDSSATISTSGLTLKAVWLSSWRNSMASRDGGTQRYD